ncbi:flagellar basal-body MS-ring/collar protein FliF [Rossellomorea vietnamensis]|uniref:flagellar basal-body MS-ring/collar protein FliF n=1 Tax=Rossellomorea vietnamensis TaxID=218284 RepID=UPI001E5B239E|nr:flagellar basal-body MS-ring/collar protein FliF [Rossellomorea vietnamensis]MCC5802767.1 flagellar M-ring protein FliF [Rossellomorea vietnamensis]
MNESFKKYTEQIKTYWTSRTKKQKISMGAIFLITLILIGAVSYFSTRTTLEPLYSNLSPSETGTIKENLDGRGIPSEITDSGSTIMVPKEQVDTLKVELAAEGIPNSGSIDYSFFSQNAGFGMTDNEFNVMKLDAMQTELANLMKGIDGIQDAKVMINLPEKQIFLNDDVQNASASIVLDTKPGFTFDQKQIKSLYHLVSKSVPDLPTENIAIMNQYFEYFDLESQNNSTGSGSFAQQMNVKKEVERDIQRQVQNMLGTLIGFNKVVVSVTTDIDFTQENREENIVTPVDEENMEGIAVSAQRITETFSGEGAAPGGTLGAGDANEPTNSGVTYGSSSESNGDYERMEETINNEVNRIKKEIVESPYKIRDLGIQVMVEPPDPEKESSLPQNRVDDIRQVLSTIVRTSIDKEANPELTDDAIAEKVVVSVQPFNGKVDVASEEKPVLPWWTYVVGGVLLVVILLLVFFLLRSRKKESIEEMEYEETREPVQIPDIEPKEETEGSIRRKQLEKMAKDKPEEFAKLLRTWLAED